MSREVPLTLGSWPQAILHLDGDAFFASCEQSIHPELKGRPVITGQERNIVASMSYEAKARGVKRTLALWEAQQICPDAVILPSDYETYSLISKRMFSIIRRFTPVVEESSIDEGYADLEGLRRLYRTSYEGIAEKIKDTIEKELDIPISLGISLTKSLAKIASRYKKPRGFTAVPGYNLHRFLKEIPVEDVSGIGPNTTALLNKHGVITAFDYVQKPEKWVKSLWGKIGVELWHELRGEMIYPLNPEEKTSYASISKTKTFTPPSKDYEYVKAHLLRNTESAFIKLRRHHLRVKRLIVYLRQQDFRGRAMQGDLSRSTICPLEAFAMVEELLKAVYQPNILYRSTGIILTNLEEDNGVQFELFEDPLRMLNMRRLAESIDEINARYGKHTVHSASGLHLARNGTNGKIVDGRHALPERRTDLLLGETFRQRVNLPLWQVKV